ncbi:MAG: hypothetical protein VYA34_16130 [Myxococcota bacterium]|nr:hypothetical protein [Myxococcota bacterium]
MIYKERRQNSRIHLNTVNITGRLHRGRERYKCRFYLRDFCRDGIGLWTLEPLNIDSFTCIRLDKMDILYGQKTEAFPKTTAKQFQFEADNFRLAGFIQWSQKQMTSHGFHSGIKISDHWATSKLFNTIAQSAATFESPALS